MKLRGKGCICCCCRRLGLVSFHHHGRKQAEVDLLPHPRTRRAHSLGLACCRVRNFLCIVSAPGVLTSGFSLGDCSVEFEDTQPHKPWPEMKTEGIESGAIPFGQLPVYEDSYGTMVQMNAILRHIGRVYSKASRVIISIFLYHLTTLLGRTIWLQ